MMLETYFRPVAGLIFFLVLSLIMTYPVVCHLWDAIPLDLGDPLLVVWVLDWDIKKILSFDLLTLWQANIFYPASYTLAYSEHFFMQALFGLPVYVLSGSPIFTYNLLFLSSFVLSGWGMYLFVRTLTGQQAPAFISGIIFAFFPYRFAHLGHLQLLTLQWVPFAFLYLHRFLHQPSSRHLTLFGLFYVMQVLSCGYYALFLSLFVGLFSVFHFVVERQLPSRDMGRQVLFLTCAVAVLTGPFFYPYIHVKELFGFSRSFEESIFFSADVMNYLCAPGGNRVWGQISQPFCKPEGQVYPGIIALLLAGLGGLSVFTNTQTPTDQKRMVGFALLMAGLAVLLSFGPYIHMNGHAYVPGPYTLLREYVPGFDSLRVPARFSAFFMFAIALLSGYGSCEILRRIKTIRLQRLVWSGIGMLLLLDYLSLPVPMPVVPGKGASLPVYRWLQEQPGRTPTLELPTGLFQNIAYVYFSTMHGKDLFNGYSGYEPPWYRSTQAVLERFPSVESVRLLEKIGIQYVIVHFDQLAVPVQQGIRVALPQVQQRVRHVASFGTTDVYQIIQTQQLTRKAAEQKLWHRP